MARLQPLNPGDRIAFATLLAMAREAPVDPEYPSNGAFQKREYGGHPYWYFQRHAGMKAGGRIMESRYVGKAGDVVVEERVAAFAEIKTSYKARRRLVAQLKKAHLPALCRPEGEVVSALARSGFFQSGVLIGCLAYQTYSGTLGIRLPPAVRANPIPGFHADHAIALHVDENRGLIARTLKRLDPSFRKLPRKRNSPWNSVFGNATGIRVVLFRPTYDVQKGSVLSKMPPAHDVAVGLPYLDFLTRNATTSVLLHADGILVRVPRPERYAVHQLIITSAQADTAFRAARPTRYITQAGTLLTALSMAGRQDEISTAWQEAWELAPALRPRLAQSARKLGPGVFKLLGAAVPTFPEEHESRRGETLDAKPEP